MAFPIHHLARKFSPVSFDTSVEDRVESLLPYLYKLAYGLVGKAADAEDLVHDTCVKVLTNNATSSLQTEGALKAWVRTVLINQFRDNYRREKKSPALHQHLDICPGTGDFAETYQNSAYSPESSAMYNDLETATCDAIESLPTDIRVVVTLYMFDDRSYKEIADLMECPLGTVMSRLSRGRRILRNMLQKYLSSEETNNEKSVRFLTVEVNRLNER